MAFSAMFNFMLLLLGLTVIIVSTSNLLNVSITINKAVWIWLADPRVFNYLIMSAYFLNIARWGYEGSIKDVCYWTSALAITATVTFLYDH